MTIENLSLPATPFELELLSKAVRYQQWVFNTVSPFLGKRILEVGSGIGNMSAWLPIREKLILTEAEESLIPTLKNTLREKTESNSQVSVVKIDLTEDWVDQLSLENIDTIVSFNVLEHIEDDEKAFCDLLEILRRSSATGPKRLVTFVPAHHWAYGSIDRKFGHFRRYSTSDFHTLKDRHAKDSKIYTRYFNLFGLPSWFFLGRVLKRDQIGYTAIKTFERICPYISSIDDFLHEKLKIQLGQSLLCVIKL